MIKITPVYTAEALNTGGRRGHVKTSDGIIDTDVAMPTTMGGTGNKPNPELFFAAGYASCFNGAIGAVAKGRDITGVEVKALVHFGKSEDGRFGIAVELHVTLPNLQGEEAKQVVSDAHQVCPYSVATQGNIEVKLFANEQAL
ncbi:MAG: organic hydroperoxide resistance protein [Raineya sp.]|jgi:Ohr subfamily peroxiredoxin|nr:organic hydroperoxide resistance protein [Raineya sp.]